VSGCKLLLEVHSPVLFTQMNKICENEAAGKAKPSDANQMTARVMMMHGFDLGPATYDWTGLTITLYRSKLRAVSVKTEMPTEVSCD
jgi:hypothetical protein